MDDTLRTLQRAGYRIMGENRTYKPTINDPHIEVRVLRPQEIPIYVADGLQDVGITGSDWIRETGADVRHLLDLGYARVRIVLAVPKSMIQFQSLGDLVLSFAEEGKTLRIATEYLGLAKESLMGLSAYRKLYGDSEPLIVTPWWKTGPNQNVAIYLSFGATEAKAPIGADAIIEVVDTGTSLRQNGLEIVEELYKSSAVLICNKESIEQSEKREKILDIATLLNGVVEARKRLHIFVNVKKENLDGLLRMLPALKEPTVSPLANSDWVAVNTVIKREEYLMCIPSLRRISQGLVVYEPLQVLPLASELPQEGSS
jgi:ATP phosphoribosyltransferase